jgi:DNA-binding XRE family transcriptional regulator
MAQRRKRPRETPRRRWRAYATSAGREPVREFLATLSDEDVAEIVAAMAVVRRLGLSQARHLRGEIYEVRANGDRQSFRILFAQDGVHDQVLLALEAFSKKQQKRLIRRSCWRSVGSRIGDPGRGQGIDAISSLRYDSWCNQRGWMTNDFLDQIIAERTGANRGFPALVQAAADRRELLRALAVERSQSGLSQTQVAAAMGTSQSQVARIEAANCDTKLSTVEKLAAVLGKRIEWTLVDL